MLAPPQAPNSSLAAQAHKAAARVDARGKQAAAKLATNATQPAGGAKQVDPRSIRAAAAEAQAAAAQAVAAQAASYR